MSRSELQAEYDAAKAQYFAAQERLRAAKAALAAVPASAKPRRLLGPMARLRGDARRARDEMLAERYHAGARMIDLAAEFGLSKGSVSRIIGLHAWQKSEAEREARWRAKYPTDPPIESRNVDLTDAPIDFIFRRISL